VGLSENHRIIFVCAVRHVRLSLARSAIAMEKKVAFAFGCNRNRYSASLLLGVGLHPLKKNGSIVKVDNSNGANVEIMICDVKSYLTAMYYMMSFNDKDDIIMYWDEPTISLDYETHELHGEIKPCGKKTRSPTSFCRARRFGRNRDSRDAIQF
jgi:hypothetical protein